LHCKYFFYGIPEFALTTPSWDWNWVLFLASERLVSDIPARDGNTSKPFYSVDSKHEKPMTKNKIFQKIYIFVCDMGVQKFIRDVKMQNFMNSSMKFKKFL